MRIRKKSFEEDEKEEGLSFCLVARVINKDSSVRTTEEKRGINHLQMFFGSLFDVLESVCVRVFVVCMWKGQNNKNNKK